MITLSALSRKRAEGEEAEEKGERFTNVIIVSAIVAAKDEEEKGKRVQGKEGCVRVDSKKT